MTERARAAADTRPRQEQQPRSREDSWSVIGASIPRLLGADIRVYSRANPALSPARAGTM